jgi:hypothetical protein
VPPYDSWATAAVGIADALRLAGDGAVVEVDDGLYRLSAELALTNGVHLKARHSRAARLDGGGAVRCVSMQHPRAQLDGFVVTGGYAGDGGGILAAAGEIRDCLVVSNTAAAYGGGVLLRDRASLAVSSVVSNSALWGGGVHCTDGGTVVRCVILGNRAEADGGGVRCLRGGHIESCLLYLNTAGELGGGAAMRSGGRMVNCTVTANRSEQTYVGGVFCHRGGSIFGSILYFNEEINLHYADPPVVLERCCITPRPRLGAGHVPQAPGFVDRRNNDYRLSAASSCVDAGDNAALTLGLDLRGRPRVSGARVDIGAFEFDPVAD